MTISKKDFHHECRGLSILLFGKYFEDLDDEDRVTVSKRVRGSSETTKKRK